MRIQVIGFSLFLNQIKLFFKAHILFSLCFALIFVSCKKSAVNNQSGQITALSPSSGVTAGGTLVSIKGLNLGSTLSVKIGNKACEISSISSEEITCTTPTNSTGSYDVLVAVNKIQTFRLSAGFSYLPDPTITSISPNNGHSSGATLVTIIGKEFKEGAIVDFGGANCENVEVISSTTLTCTTTLHYGGTVDVTITNTNNQSGTSIAAFTYIAPPTVSHISPSAGALSGSTTITLTGSNFLTGITVNLGGGSCSDVRILSPNSLTCMTPAHAAGSVSVTVTNSDSQSQTVAGLYTYQAAPTLTSVSPNEGPLGGNTSVILTGTNFSFGAIAKFNAKPCTNQLILSTTSISCTTPLQFFTGAFDITVTNLDNQVATYSSAFTYNNPPTITSISPNSGYAIGGTAITITGTGFRSGASVDLGGVACTVTLLSATSITCTTAAHAAATVNAIITNSDNQSGSKLSAYTFQAAPTISSLSPIGGAIAGDSLLTLTGTGFVTGASVSVGGSACTSVNVVSSTSITCTTPAHAAGIVSVTVTNTDTQVATLSNSYTYQDAPTVVSVSPTSGTLAGGTVLTVTGTGFNADTTIHLGGNICSVPVLLNSSTIQCSIPTRMSAGAVNIVATNLDLQTGTLTNGFIYIAPPTVSAISPSAGAFVGGNTVTITGTNFFDGATVKLDGLNCTSVNFINSTTLTCLTPAHAAGVVDVSVTNTDLQIGTLISSFTYKAAPTVTALSTLTGRLAGGQSITITGSGFADGASVVFDSSACTSVNVLSSTSLTCIIPAHAAGVVSVTVKNSDTQEATLAAAYIYQPAPTVVSVSPTSGIISGGTVITITGTGFVSGASASIGGSACTGLAIVNSSTITCTTPAHSAGAVSVSVTNSDAQSGSAAAAYTFNSAPTVTSVSGGTGNTAGGESLSIVGANFVSGATVSIDGSACGAAVVFNSATSLTCPSTPAHAAGSVSVVVTNPDTQTATLAYAYSYGSPTVTSVSQSAGALAGGTSVTITGTNFAHGATADFGGSACSNLSVVDSTTITCLTSAHVAGAVTVTVTNANTQLGTQASAYTYQAAPTVISVSPSAGALAGSIVTITGSGFLPSVTASVGGSSCTPISFANTTTIQCTTAPHIAGPVVVTVTNDDTQSGSTVAYTYQAAPTVTSVTSNTGSIAGDTFVTLTGTGFLAGATVSFDGSNCTSVALISSTSLTCRTPAHAAGVVSVSITNPDTQSGSLAAAFTYQSMSLLEWQVGASSPTPPNPDSFGSTSVNVTHTYTLKNSGDISTSAITIISTGGTPAAWFFGTDNCSTFTLAPGASCTVQVTFLGQYLTTGQSYTTTLSASATIGGTTTNTMNASVP